MAKTSQTTYINQPLGKVRTASIEALEECRFSVKEKTGNTIKASSGVSVWSWGEEVVVDLASRHEGTEVRVTSRSNQLFDWGKCGKNIEKFLSNLEKKLAE